MAVALELSGIRFERLLVIRRNGTACHQSMWLCQCDCGATKAVRGGHLTSGRIKSCGCHKDELARNRAVHGHARRGRISPEWEKWSHAKQRCANPKGERYSSYGGRGIRMCDEWANSFENFLRDMGPCPSGYELDRIDVNGNYEPGNCRWVTSTVQANNKRSNRYCEVDGQTMTVSQASRLRGLAPGVVYARLHRGWSVERALQAETVA